jgi:hypothetical protein
MFRVHVLGALIRATWASHTRASQQPRKAPHALVEVAEAPAVSPFVACHARGARPICFPPGAVYGTARSQSSSPTE